MPRPAPFRRSTRTSLLALVNTANAFHPARYSRAFQVPSFFSSWLTSEAAWSYIVLTVARSAGMIRRGEHRDLEGKVALGANALAVAGLAQLMVEGRRADEQFEAALSPWLDQATLDARPRSERAGAWLPVLYGGRGRRVRTRGVTFSGGDGGKRLKLDVYEPLAARTPGERRPAIVQIHGGGWVIGDKREQGIPLLNHLASNGWVGFNVNYRLSPKVRAPGHLVDCKRAIAWIREHADDYGIDPEFICVTGGSAGGHLAAMVALTAGDPEYQPGFEDADTSVQAAVPFYGLYDFTDTSLMTPGFLEMFAEPMLFAVKYTNDPTPFERYSPLYRVRPDAPPMMMVHGTRDALIPIESARPFAAKMAAESQHAVVWVELDGAQHAFDIFPSARTVRTVEYVERFLDGVRRGVIK